MAAAFDPPVARHLLGAYLAGLRRDSGKSIADVRTVLGCSQPKASKLESGRHSITLPEIKALLDLYDVTDENTRARIIELGQDARRRTRGPSDLEALSEDDRVFLTLLADGKTLHTYEPDIVPGLLQTEDYARALIAGAGEDQSPDAVERGVRARMDLQARVLIKNESPPRVHAIVAEPVLHWQVGGPGVMRDQLAALLAPPTNVELRVVPFSAGAHPGMAGTLTILELADPILRPLYYMESQAGNVLIDRDERVDACTVTYQRLSERALSASDSANLIRETIRRGESDEPVRDQLQRH